ncbi:MAG: peptidase T [Lachnospiraceae bacterium]|nr:peptidase T [Lachnospiraceae bacterium]
MYREVTERFLRYCKVDTQSDEESGTSPTTEKQKDLGRMLAAELKEMGASEVFFDEQNCYVYASVPASGGSAGKTLAFLAHMDTSPEVSGKDVTPRIVEDYDGADIVLNQEKQIVLSPATYPELHAYQGQDLIVTDGATLLGADDKAGVAEIMTMAAFLLQHPEIPHGKIAICFTPDEEVGQGVDHIDLNRLGAEYAYTVDGGALGELEYENFNAAAAKAAFHGISVHPGEAKGKMVNASLLAMEFLSKLPPDARPENTEGYEGFFHLTEMKGSIEEAEISLIVRDHDKEKFEEKKTLLRSIAQVMGKQYGEGTVTLTLEDSYYNMKEKIEPEHLFLVDCAKQAMESLSITPKVQPIRGGTDGARLSYMGLPCPNLCAGGHNFHGRFEYIPVQSMERITALLVRIVETFPW